MLPSILSSLPGPHFLETPSPSHFLPGEQWGRSRDLSLLSLLRSPVGLPGWRSVTCSTWGLLIQLSLVHLLLESC